MGSQFNVMSVLDGSIVCVWAMKMQKKFQKICTSVIIVMKANGEV